MITHKSDQVKEFYNRQPFPGPYTARSVKEYTGHNRYISFISDAITHSRRVLDAGSGTGFITNYLAKIYPCFAFLSAAVIACLIPLKLLLELNCYSSPQPCGCCISPSALRLLYPFLSRPAVVLLPQPAGCCTPSSAVRLIV